MKKILYLITQSHYGGAQKYVHDLVLQIPKDTYDIHVAVGEGKHEQWMQDIKDEGISLIRLRHVKRNLSLYHDLMSGFELFFLYKHLKPNIIHLNSTKIGLTGALIAKLYNLFTKSKQKTKIIYTVHGFILDEPLPLWRHAFYYVAEKIGAHFKDIVICVSEQSKKSLLRRKIVNQKKITVIHNGIDLNNINFLPKEKAREFLFNTVHYQLKTKSIIIGCIAGLYKTKGLDYLIESIHILITSYRLSPQGGIPITGLVTCFIIGSGPEHDHLTELIKKYKLKKQIILTGNIENAAQYLKTFDIFVLPSVKEGLSYTLIEARAAGLPVITTNVGGNPEVITNQKTGILIPAKDPQAITEALHALIKDNTSREALAKLSTQRINDFSLESMVKKTTEIYVRP